MTGGFVFEKDAAIPYSKPQYAHTLSDHSDGQTPSS